MAKGFPAPTSAAVGRSATVGAGKSILRIIMHGLGPDNAHRFARAEMVPCHIVRPLAAPRAFFTPGSEGHWPDANTRMVLPAMQAAKERMVRQGFAPAVLRTAVFEEKTGRAEGIAEQAEALGLGTIVGGRRGPTSVPAFSMGRVIRKILQMAHQKAIWII